MWEWVPITWPHCRGNSWEQRCLRVPRCCACMFCCLFLMQYSLEISFKCPSVYVNGGCRFVGVIRIWEVESGDLLHSLRPLDHSTQFGDGGQNSSKSSEDSEEQTSQTYTDLLLCAATHSLVGVTFDQNIIFYNLMDTSRVREVSSNHTHKSMWEEEWWWCVSWRSKRKWEREKEREWAKVVPKADLLVLRMEWIGFLFCAGWW